MNPKKQFNILANVLGLSRSYKTLFLLATDYILLFVVASISLYIDNPTLNILDIHRQNFLFTLIAPVVTVSSLLIFQKYQSISRFYDLDNLSKLFLAFVFSFLLLQALLQSINLNYLTISTQIIYVLLGFIVLASIRVYFSKFYLSTIKAKSGVKNILIYGAGEAGKKLYSALKHSNEFCVKGFIDDNINLLGKSLHNKKVFGYEQSKLVIKKHSIDKILLAIPSLETFERAKIITKLSELNIRVQVVPSVEEILLGKEIINFRDINFDDILGRLVIEPDKKLIIPSVKNKTILITGAGGTIGSELAKIIAMYAPREMILIDSSEYALYTIERNLINLPSKLRLHTYLGSVTDKKFLSQIFNFHKIETIYHAAAYKHVPLVEKNPFVGSYNNIWGTLNVSDLARKHNSERFVLISTDKAVRPTNIMGASKRLAELILQSAASSKGCNTKFSMVRFGNVLGSSGSVIPAFIEQINSGGPVIVTHKNINRFFMTINEASYLVIQAGTLAEGGEVFLLDMGEPVKINKLAENLIKLHGLSVKDKKNPNGDIEIIFSGLRPGEKLYEELLIDATSKKTSHPKIYSAQESFLTKRELNIALKDIKFAIEKNEINLLKEAFGKVVSGYRS